MQHEKEEQRLRLRMRCAHSRSPIRDLESSRVSSRQAPKVRFNLTILRGKRQSGFNLKSLRKANLESLTVWPVVNTQAGIRSYFKIFALLCAFCAANVEEPKDALASTGKWGLTRLSRSPYRRELGDRRRRYSATNAFPTRVIPFGVNISIGTLRAQ